MLLKSLYIKNFRALEDFEVKQLGRLNLIVGKNNSGKSSVLEALSIYAANADRSQLIEIAARHDEKYQMDIKDRNEDDSFLPFESFFTGRCFPADEQQCILICETIDSPEALRLHHGYFVREETEITNEGERTTQVRMRLISKAGLHAEHGERVAQYISISKGRNFFSFIPLDEYNKRFNPLAENYAKLPCSYITTQFISQDELADEWDDIALTQFEDHIKTAFKFIDNDFEAIAFIKNSNKGDTSRWGRVAQNRIAKVKMANIQQPIALNSMGDGMLRIFQLALKTLSAKGGILLIDEFENGLHFSVQVKVWSWLFDMAELYNIQIFATTHSWDCVDSFSKVACSKEQTSAVLFRVGRSVKTSSSGKIIATEFDKESLATITQADVEVR